MKYYTLDACEKLIDKYVNEKGGSISTIDEGCLGLGTLVLYGAENLKTIVIK